jgi:hypothetical protein
MLQALELSTENAAGKSLAMISIELGHGEDEIMISKGSEMDLQKFNRGGGGERKRKKERECVCV